MFIRRRAIQELISKVIMFSDNYPGLAKEATTILRWVFVLLALYILVRSIMSLLSTRATPEVWGYFLVQDGGNFPITHWENVIGRSKSADICIPLSTVSKSQVVLIRRDDDSWLIKDIGSKNGTVVNGIVLEPGKRYIIGIGDEIVISGVHCTIAPASLEESANNRAMREGDREPIAPWKLMLAISLFQLLTLVQLVLSMGEAITPRVIISFAALCAIMWVYTSVFKALGRKGFEMEMIAFFMTTINLAVTASARPDDTFKQLIAMVMGLCLMIFMCIYMRDLHRTKQLRPILIGLSVGLLLFNLIFGQMRYGAVNWVSIGGMTFQPSEIVKLAFVCIGAGTLEELFERRNTVMYAGFSLFCLGCLALMGDFGTALIYFATYLVVSFLRSGDLSRLILTVVGAGVMGLMVLRFKPYIATRFATWGHVWEDPDNAGYQQTRTMSFGAGGGLLGHGAGNGQLKNVGASDTDLIFGFVMEEWGLIIAVLLVLCLITLALFAVLSIIAGRSTFYTIGACGAATILLIQTMLNIFGALDLFPLTGVTFPFVSTGGTSMLTSWAMLSFFKAADMRRNASLALFKED